MIMKLLAVQLIKNGKEANEERESEEKKMMRKIILMMKKRKMFKKDYNKEE